MAVEDFFHLCIDPDDDRRQDQFIELLEHEPQTEFEAKLLLKRLHHRHEYHARQQRRRFLPITREPSTPILQSGHLLYLLADLEPIEREIVHLHSCGESYREIAIQLGISRETVRRRCRIIIVKIRRRCVPNETPPIPYK